jgi:hypothetical protein
MRADLLKKMVSVKHRAAGSPPSLMNSGLS